MPALLVERFTEPFDHFLALAGLLGGIQRFVSPCVRHKNLRAALVRHVGPGGNLQKRVRGCVRSMRTSKIQVDWGFQKLVDRFLNHLFDGKPLLGSDDFQLLQGPLRNR